MYAYLLSYSNNLIPKLLTKVNEYGINFSTEVLTDYSPKSKGSKNDLATLYNASAGHGWNQSMTVQLTKAGNYLALLLISPTGEKHIDICKFFLILSTNQFQQFSLVSGLPSPLTFPLTLFIIASFSSNVYKSAISPEDNKSFIYTKNLSFVI